MQTQIALSNSWRIATLVGLVLLSSCAGYAGSAQDASSAGLNEKGWLKVDSVPVVLQEGEKDCGAASVSAVLAHYGIRSTPAQIRTDIGREADVGLSSTEMRDYLRARGLRAFVFQGDEADLRHEIAAGRPVIVGVVKPQTSGRGLAHYEVVLGYHLHDGRVLTLDPARGLRVNTRSGFDAEWNYSGRVTLVVIAAPNGQRTAQF